MHWPCGQIGVRTAGYQAPSAPHKKTLQNPFAQLVEQNPGPPQVAGAAFLRFAASADAIDMVMAKTATAPANTSFEVNFIMVESSPL